MTTEERIDKMKDYLKEYQNWLESPDFDEETKNELKSIKDDEKEIEDRFYKELEFGNFQINMFLFHLHLILMLFVY